jgi:hypothetical protein
MGFIMGFCCRFWKTVLVYALFFIGSLLGQYVEFYIISLLFLLHYFHFYFYELYEQFHIISLYYFFSDAEPKPESGPQGTASFGGAGTGAAT